MPIETQSEVAAAFDNYLRFGVSGLTRHDREIMRARYVADPRMSAELGAIGIRASQSGGSGSAGGYSVPDEAMPPIVEALKAFGGMRAVSTVLQTRTGADLPIPNDDDTSMVGEIINENTNHAEGDIALGQVFLQGFTYSSKIIKVSRQFLQDFNGNVAAYLGGKIGARIGRIQNTHFTTGDGSSKPLGIVPASSSGVLAASASAVAYDELVDLMQAVDPAYQGNGKWMLNLSTLGMIRKLADVNGQPLWGTLASEGPDTVLGKPYIINQDMPNVTTGSKSVLYGDFSNYYIRDVGNVIVLRLDERFAAELQVAFIGFLRSDGDLVDAGTNPVKHLIQA